MTRTLVLNASYEPLCVVPLKRAIVLVLAEKATIVESGERALRSANFAVDAPQVIVLTRHVRVPYRRTVPFSRRAVLSRDGHKCAYCGRSASTIDHVTPRSLGGRDSFENCVAACLRCNGKKGNKTLAELGWTLPFTPKAPEAWTALVVGYASVDPTWTPYLTASWTAEVTPVG